MKGMFHLEFNSSSTGHKNYINNFFEHFLSKLLDLQKSLFGDVILEINYLKNEVIKK